LINLELGPWQKTINNYIEMICNFITLCRELKQKIDDLKIYEEMKSFYEQTVNKARMKRKLFEGWKVNKTDK